VSLAVIAPVMGMGMALPLGEEGATEDSASEALPMEGKPEGHCSQALTGWTTGAQAVEMKQRFLFLHYPELPAMTKNPPSSHLGSTHYRLESPQREEQYTRH